MRSRVARAAVAPVVVDPIEVVDVADCSGAVVRRVRVEQSKLNLVRRSRAECAAPRAASD